MTGAGHMRHDLVSLKRFVAVAECGNPLAATRARVAVPVLTAPDAAVAKLRSLVQ